MTSRTTFESSEFLSRRRRLVDHLALWGVEAVIVTTPSDLRYLTGFSGRSPLGPSPFVEGPESALVVGRGCEVLCLPDMYVNEVPPQASITPAPFTTFADIRPLEGRHRLADGIVEAIANITPSPAVIGVQTVSAPASVADAIQREFRGRIADVGGSVRRLRMIKSAEELTVIRGAVRVCDRAQAAVRASAQPGARETDVLEAVAESIRGDLGDVPFIHEITSGHRSGTIGNTANETVIGAGDFVLSDIAPPVDGYWGDSCGTLVAGGEPSGKQAQMLEVVAEALRRGTQAVRPGILASELDATMREHIAEAGFPPYPGAGGHGVGVDYHEPPRLVPDDFTPLEAGMVLAMEPGIYLPDVGGIRLEHLIHVVADGCEVISRHLGPETRM